MEALDLIIDGDNGKETLRSYLKNLLITLWKEEEHFSGKRPFGNSGWQHDVFQVLILNNLIEGKLDEDGYIEDFEYRDGLQYVCELIEEVFKE